MRGLVEALTDRHDITAAREQQAQPPSGMPLESELMIRELLSIFRTLQGTLTQDRAAITQLCVTDREPAQFQMRNFPVPGAERLIVRRPGAGGSYTLVANTPTLLVAANENRLGLTIVNSGPNKVTLYGSVDLLEPGSSSPLAGGAPQAILASGMSWDGRLGTLFWCGSVLAIDTTGGSVLSVWEV